MHVFRERASAMTQTKYCPNQDPGQSVTSSYHLNQSALRVSTGYTRERNGYSFVNTRRLQKKSRGEYASLSLCRAGQQQQVKSANWNLFAYAKEQL